VVFEADDDIKLQNIVMTSSPLCHRKKSQKIFQFGALAQIKIYGYASGLELII